MAGKIYVGNSLNKAVKPSKIYAGGSDNKAHLVKAIYVGDSSNKARKVWPMSDIIDSRFEQLGWVTSNSAGIYPSPNPIMYPRIVMEFNVPSSDLGSVSDVSSFTSFIRSRIDYEYTIDGAVSTGGLHISYDFYPDDRRFECFSSAVDTPPDSQTESYDSVDISSNDQEGIIIDTTYIVDFTVGGTVNLYNSLGYYSISSNNNLGSFKKYSAPDYANTTTYSTNFFVYYYYNIKIYNILIYNESSVLTHKFVPCYRISDNKLGFFDTVNRIFYPNSTYTTADTDYYGRI